MLPAGLVAQPADRADHHRLRSSIPPPGPSSGWSWAPAPATWCARATPTRARTSGTIATAHAGPAERAPR